MGNSQNKTLIIWIDQNVNNNENKTLQKELESHKGIELESFDSEEKGIKLLKKTKFKNTIIITSGYLYPKFYEQFQKITEEIMIIPKIIIFTRDANKFILENINKLPLKDPFFNSGGVVDRLEDIKNFIESSTDQNQPGFEGNNDEIFEIQYIKEKNDLILPLYYHENLRACTEKEIKEFNEKILSENKTNTAIEFIFSQLAASGNIPIKLLTKFWLRAYSVHSSFSKKMNGDLAGGKFKPYFPFILKLYESFEKKFFSIEKSKLYKGIIAQERDWKQFFLDFKPKVKEDDIPIAVLYSSSFFSFYKDEKTVKKSREIRKGEIYRYDIFIRLILEGTSNSGNIKNQINIDKEISYYESGDEVLFLPFSCFEIKNVEKKGDKDYEITLNYLHSYSKLFSDEERKPFVNVTENDYSKVVFDSGLINTGIIEKPLWLKNDTIIIPNDKKIIIIKSIKDNHFLEKVKKHCFDVISQNDSNNNYDNLRDIVQDYLKQQIPNSNWWIIISNEQSNNYENLNTDSVMIFQYNNSSKKFYIHIAKLST